MDNKTSLEEQLAKYKEFLTTKDLVGMGLYSSIDLAYAARLIGDSPNFVKMKRKILYPKAEVIKFLEGRLKDGMNKSVL